MYLITYKICRIITYIYNRNKVRGERGKGTKDCSGNWTVGNKGIMVYAFKGMRDLGLYLLSKRGINNVCLLYVDVRLQPGAGRV